MVSMSQVELRGGLVSFPCEGCGYKVTVDLRGLTEPVVLCPSCQAAYALTPVEGRSLGLAGFDGQAPEGIDTGAVVGSALFLGVSSALLSTLIFAQFPTKEDSAGVRQEKIGRIAGSALASFSVALVAALLLERK